MTTERDSAVNSVRATRQSSSASIRVEILHKAYILHKRGYFALIVWTVWVVVTFAALLLQANVGDTFNTRRAIEEIYLESFTDDARGVELNFETISNRDQWSDWLSQVGLASFYGVSDLRDVATDLRAYTCANGEEILKSRRCDGIEHCEDGSDEAGCRAVDQEFVSASGTLVDLDSDTRLSGSAASLDGADLNITCTNGRMLVHPLGGTLITTLPREYDLLNRADVTNAYTSGHMSSNSTSIIEGSTIVARTPLNQYYKIDGRGRCENAVSWRYQPVIQPCFTDEYWCGLTANASNIDSFGNFAGRCLHECLICNQEADCLVDTSVWGDSPEEQLASCSECGPFIDTFTSARLKLAGFPMVGMARFQGAECADSQLSLLSSECAGANFKDSDLSLCVGYCESVVEVALTDNTTTHVPMCSGSVVTDEYVARLVSTPTTPEEFARQRDCLFFTGSPGSDEFTAELSSTCAWDATKKVEFFDTVNMLGDDTSRAFVKLALFSPDTNALYLCEFSLHFTRTAKVSPEFEIKGIHLNLYTTDRARTMARVVLEVLSLVIFLIFVATTLGGMYRHRHELGKYFSQTGHLMDVMFFATYVAVVWTWVLYASDVADIQGVCNSYSLDDSLRLSRQVLNAADSHDTYEVAMTFFMFAVVLQTFRILSFQAYLELIVRTVRNSSGLLVSLLILAFYTFGSFSVLAHVAFGTSNASYASFDKVIPNLFAMMIGEVNFKDLEESNASIAPFFILFYIVIVSLVVLNLVIAVLINTFHGNMVDMEGRKSILGELRMFLTDYLRRLPTPVSWRRRGKTGVMAQENAGEGGTELAEVGSPTLSTAVHNLNALEYRAEVMEKQLAKLHALLQRKL